MSEVYFIADLHLGHNRVTRFRTEFKTMEEHDLYVTSKVINVSNKRDTLYVLGDVCLDKCSLPLFERICSQFKKVCIVLGNHDLERATGPTLTDYLTIPNLELKGFVKYKEFYLSHCPIHPEHLRGKVNIHGHLHEKHVDNDRYINVSCESVEYVPMSLVEIRNILL